MKRIYASAAVAFTFGLIGLGTDAQAQSFDCREAKSRVERLICRDEALEKLDAELDHAYRSAMDNGDSRTVMNDQRQWLRLRKGVQDAATLKRLYSDRIHILATTPTARLVTVRNDDLGLAITLPSNRSIRQCRRDQHCIEIHGSRSGFMGMLLRLQAVDKPLEKAARDEAGFEEDHGRWMTTYGRFDPVPVERFSGADWKGMRAVVICGTFDKETGFHAAGGECLSAVLSNNSRSIVASTDGDVDWQKDAEVILKSLRFTR